MAEPPTAARISAKDLITLACAIIGAAFVIAGAIRTDGQREERLKAVEIKADETARRLDQRGDLLNQIDVRTARIEATLQMMNRGPR